MGNWGVEEWRALSAGARVIDVPVDGESEPVPIRDVLDRKVWYEVGGIYTLRSADGTVQYIGLTADPLRKRLYLALANKKTWTRADHADWTVTLRRAPTTYPDDLALQRRLVAEQKPPYNVVGRPRNTFTPREG